MMINSPLADISKNSSEILDECFKVGIKWTDYIYDTDRETFDDVLSRCTAKPWRDNGDPDMVKIDFKPRLTEKEKDATRERLFEMFIKAQNRWSLICGNGIWPPAVFDLCNEMLVSNNSVRIVIGRGGQTIGGIQQSTGVECIYFEARDKCLQGYSKLIIKGSNIRTIQKARNAVKNAIMIANNNKNSPRFHTAVVADKDRKTKRSTITRANSEESVLEIPAKKCARTYVDKEQRVSFFFNNTQLAQVQQQHKPKMPKSPHPALLKQPLKSSYSSIHSVNSGAIVNHPSSSNKAARMLDFTCSDSPIAYDHRVDINRKREAEAHFDSDDVPEPEPEVEQESDPEALFDSLLRQIKTLKDVWLSEKKTLIKENERLKLKLAMGNHSKKHLNQ